ncbi:hypothetical protein [Rubrivivax gelatinosus]|uniref:Putative membrane protein n=1 Tax=Rubrivivax gelatinosus (strain NBRC 100245 / IL144) TaxID=983917 RepID=I0HUG4_RUBGI|nr:hypothetical protein [Rubrivivax gelatinosus]MBG6078569.1 4-amino-4-deoxy-L-arabinose transferase-like glycosyltransferase [Rubrivivax gelatinosus]BAL96651.1 putative membrane protein [Rubrivivax gelatinosus IL144]
MSSPNPALVTQRGARSLPRLALLVFCAAYVLPGVFHRDPWRNADLVAYGLMSAIAEGRTSWLSPTLGGVPADAALLPHWLGALAIQWLGPLFGDGAFAARVPFALLLALAMVLVWYTTYYLARTQAAQPVAFAFGGEADPVDYARAIADGALLALIATLGLLQLGHETTPELGQLVGVGLFMLALAIAPFRRWQPRVAIVAALLVLAGSGAPATALGIGLGGVLVCMRSAYDTVRRFAPWVAAATLASAALAAWLGAWQWRASWPDADDAVTLARQWAWFLWPAWPLVLWTLWQWRRHLTHRHISVPLVTVVVAMVGAIATNMNERLLMLAIPGLAVLAAFALPTLKRTSSAAIDWFSMFFFTFGAIAIWFFYVAMQTGVPAKPAANALRLVPGYVVRFEPVELAFALAGTLAWLWLLRWRTGRHREALWKSMVIPAGGVALCWLLLMTLWRAPLDYARSSRPEVEHLRAYVASGGCIAAPGAPSVAVAALEVFGRYQIDASPDAVNGRCDNLLYRVRGVKPPPAPPGWVHVATLQRMQDRGERFALYRRQAAPAAAVEAPEAAAR